MSVLNYFKNTPGRPLIGRQALSVIFFLKICNEVPGKKGGPVAPAMGDRVLSPPLGRQGPVARWGGRQGPLPLSRRMPPFLLSFEPKNS